MKLRVATPPALVDIGRLPELNGITLDGDTLRIGAMTTHATVAASPVVRENCPILAEAAGLIGDQQVRNRGTLGGSLAHADPAADLPTVVVALGGTLTATGADGERDIPAGECFVDLFTTALAEGEVLTRINIPAYGAGTGGAYAKHRHPASGYAVVGVAAMITVSAGRCTGARVVIGGAQPIPVRAAAAEAALDGQALDEAAISAAAAAVAEAITDPLSDHYASGEYRRHLATVLAKRAIAKAVERAAGA
jgi:carbon-monoxide dehydrogenase medium subunit